MQRSHFPETLHAGIDSEALVGQPIMAAAAFQAAFRWCARRFPSQETLPKGSSFARVNTFSGRRLVPKRHSFRAFNHDHILSAQSLTRASMDDTPERPAIAKVDHSRFVYMAEARRNADKW